MMEMFAKEAATIKRNDNYKVWQDGYHPEEIITQPFMDQKLHYIHYNAVEAGFVTEPHHYACLIRTTSFHTRRVTMQSFAEEVDRHVDVSLAPASRG